MQLYMMAEYKWDNFWIFACREDLLLEKATKYNNSKIYKCLFKNWLESFFIFLNNLQYDDDDEVHYKASYVHINVWYLYYLTAI